MAPKKFKAPWAEPGPPRAPDEPEPPRASGWIDGPVSQRDREDLLRRVNRAAPNVTRGTGEIHIVMSPSRTFRLVLSKDAKGQIDASMVKEWRTLA